MASAANLENKQTLNKAYRKTKYFPKKLKAYLWISILKLYLQYSYWSFLRVPTSVFGYHKGTIKQPQGVVEKKKIKIFITREYLIFMSSVNCSKPLLQGSYPFSETIFQDFSRTFPGLRLIFPGLKNSF